MPRHHKNLNRLFIDADLRVGKSFKLDMAQNNYLLNVMRKKEGDQIILFNGRDGAFLAEIAEAHRKGSTIAVIQAHAKQTPTSDLWYMFAPLKSGRLDYMVQKATEMGVGHLQPVITQHTQLVGSLKIDKIRANVIEAAEQCEILSVPKVHDQVSLVKLIEQWPTEHAGRKLVFADEGAPVDGAAPSLMEIKDQPIALLVGPEGGFSADERKLLLDQEFCVPISLGPRILRADTAAVAALAIIQSNIGDLR
ncbi:16S rRNA (uracil(1498)-N(3))-methyltransferase [Maritalea porphyrae]|jgi:16S rRNA (uracil1498-N3)-methyltransferase|uniref:16S rRNA (uracil(1498)-N(3))-methyltransferase n=1 Tax=Maritalea porphyrae TaxID=880732 RepID=UPI0022AEFF95|nr:16S rRNA (uracil(1498)-N(3))-methyltransferase [Maritalea porphyrae]MCZ4271413.1 16S rRNA (uracil(1498)-N(3))-methyltransferase [Maritalea porphyrae]